MRNREGKKIPTVNVDYVACVPEFHVYYRHPETKEEMVGSVVADYYTRDENTTYFYVKRKWKKDKWVQAFRSENIINIHHISTRNGTIYK